MRAEANLKASITLDHICGAENRLVAPGGFGGGCDYIYVARECLGAAALCMLMMEASVNLMEVCTHAENSVLLYVHLKFSFLDC
jgi:hypothetical protein